MHLRFLLQTDPTGLETERREMCWLVFLYILLPKISVLLTSLSCAHGHATANEKATYFRAVVEALPNERVNMVSRTLVDAWNSWTHFRSAQEFMDDSRIRGRETIGAAVDSYVIEIPAMRPGWAGLNAEELEDIRDLLMSYLFLTQGVEWN